MMLLLIVCVLCVSLTALHIRPLFGLLFWLIIKTSFLFRLPKKNKPSAGCSAYSAAIRIAVLAYYQDKFSVPSAKKK
nr:MAG TPA: hypothetical protein [Inoviridae sp.]